MDFHICDNKTHLFRPHLTSDTQRRHPTALAMQPGPQPRSTVAAYAVPCNQAAVHLHGSTGSAAPCSAHITHHTHVQLSSR
jgi:hypothetical protein